MRLYKTWQAVDADAQQEALNKTRAIFQKVPIIPAMKTVIAEKSGDKVWATVRPPLVELNDAQRAQLIRELDADGFGIPNAAELADQRRPIEKIAYLFGLYRRFIMSIKHSAASRLPAVLAFATVFVFAFMSLVAVVAAQPYGQGQGGPGNMMGGGWGWGMGYGMGGVGGIGVLVLGLVVLGIAVMAFRRRSP